MTPSQEEQDFECEVTKDDNGGPPPGIFDVTFDTTFN